MDMLNYSPPSKRDIVLENILQDLANNVIQAVSKAQQRGEMVGLQLVSDAGQRLC